MSWPKFSQVKLSKRWHGSNGTMTEFEFRAWCLMFKKNMRWVLRVVPEKFFTRRGGLYREIALRRARDMLGDIREAGYRHIAEEVEAVILQAEQA